MTQYIYNGCKNSMMGLPCVVIAEFVNSLHHIDYDGHPIKPDTKYKVKLVESSLTTNVFGRNLHALNQDFVDGDCNERVVHDKVRVKFPETRKSYSYHNALRVPLRPGDTVVVEVYNEHKIAVVKDFHDGPANRNLICRVPLEDVADAVKKNNLRLELKAKMKSRLEFLRQQKDLDYYLERDDELKCMHDQLDDLD